MQSFETAREHAEKDLAERLLFELEKQGDRYSLGRKTGDHARRDNLTLDEVEHVLERWKLQGSTATDIWSYWASARSISPSTTCLRSVPSQVRIILTFSFPLPARFSARTTCSMACCEVMPTSLRYLRIEMLKRSMFEPPEADHLNLRQELPIVEAAMDLSLKPIGDGPNQEFAAGVARHLRAPQPALFRPELGTRAVRQGEDPGCKIHLVLCLGGGAPAPPRARARGQGRCHGLGLWGCHRGDVVAAHAVLAHVGDEGKVELLAHQAAEEAAHGMALPTSLGDDVVNGDA